MAADAAHAAMGGSLGLEHAVALLATAVIAAPLFKRLGLGSVLGYLAAGVLIGPFGFALFNDPMSILHVAEFGVVMFLFIIGLEMRPAKLWALRKEIFGLGAAQVITCIILLTGVGMAFGIPWAPAAVGASGFVLSSTAVIMKMLDDAGDTATTAGQRAISILLFEDLMIVPLLAGVAVIAGLTVGVADNAPPLWQSIAIALAAVAVVFVAGRYVMNPMFAILARSGAREVMTAAALLVVLGAALLMDLGGLSMAMGAFLAGVLLSDSVFRHQLEADVEPFRGILLALFFISVGMSLDLAVVFGEWVMVAAGVAAFMIVKAIGIYVIARLFKADHREGVHRAALFAQGGEFAFVLYAAALSSGVMDASISAIMTAIVIISMALTPLVVIVLNRFDKPPEQSRDGIEDARDLNGRVLFIGFGRFAQVVSQPLLARGVDVSLIEIDVEMIRAAADFGFKVYYGDGSRLDVLHASGADKAEAILVCVDKPDAADRIVALCQSEFPHAKLFVRAFDRGHVHRLVKAGVDYQIREVFESALAFSGAVMRQLDFDDFTIAETIEEVRERDAARIELELAGGIDAGKALIRGNAQTPTPTPFIKPRREGKALNDEAAEVIEDDGA